MKIIIKKIYYFFSRTYIKVLGKLYPIEKKILFDSFSGKQYSDNPRAISEKLHELYPDYEIVWNIRKQNNKYDIIPSYVRLIERGKIGLLFYKELATSFCYISNIEMRTKLYKRKGQIFIQTWHGDRSFKKVMYDSIKDGEKIHFPVIDSEYTDLCISGSDIGEKMFRSAFKYNGKIMKVGMPRNDKLVNNIGDKIEIKKRLSIPISKKILLYAPTFRDNDSDISMIDFNKILEVMNYKTDEWIILKRFHLGTHNIEKNYNSRFIYDVTDYPDMADLLFISDCLITDYSSCAGDFLLLNKPVFITAFDKKSYEDNCRKLNFSIDDSGYYVVENQIELEEALKNIYIEDWVKRSNTLRAFFGIRETGKSSEIIVNWINKNYLKFLDNTSK